VNIQDIRLFTRMRAVLSTHQELLLQLEKLRGTVTHNTRDIKQVFNLLKKMQAEERNRLLLVQIAKEKKEQRPAVGFKTDREKSKQ